MKKTASSDHGSSGSSLGSTTSHTDADIIADGTGRSTPLSNNPSDTSQRGFSELVRVEYLSPLSTTASSELCLIDEADFSTSGTTFSIVDDDEERPTSPDGQDALGDEDEDSGSLDVQDVDDEDDQHQMHHGLDLDEYLHKGDGENTTIFSTNTSPGADSSGIAG